MKNINVELLIKQLDRPSLELLILQTLNHLEKDSATQIVELMVQGVADKILKLK
jgi:hypothetical protein